MKCPEIQCYENKLLIYVRFAGGGLTVATNQYRKLKFLKLTLSMQTIYRQNLALFSNISKVYR